MTDRRDAPQQSSLFDTRNRRPQQRWIEAQQRRDAEKAAWFSRDPAVVAADLTRLEDILINRARWKIATTMMDNPHCYTLRRTWKAPDLSDADFRWTVQVIRTIGDRERFPPAPAPNGRWYTVLNLRDAKYWTMCWPIDYSSGAPWTILINRKPPRLATDRR
jgi:hypothetical protein